MSQETKELKNNVKWLKNGLVVGYGYSAGEEGYVDPKLEKTFREENKEGKLEENKYNLLKYLVKNDFVEEL